MWLRESRDLAADTAVWWLSSYSRAVVVWLNYVFKWSIKSKKTVRGGLPDTDPGLGLICVRGNRPYNILPITDWYYPTCECYYMSLDITIVKRLFNVGHVRFHPLIPLSRQKSTDQQAVTPLLVSPCFHEGVPGYTHLSCLFFSNSTLYSFM